ncbi:hypothetical protein [Neisseria elongata]|jgi:hypothetical protein|uniref:hypothetical protein n=1 Tax=Neisseria elongata TaxID=495 RepID=UPI0024B262E9|nr:hypothetical protein [Neisseria elongata]
MFFKHQNEVWAALIGTLNIAKLLGKSAGSSLAGRSMTASSFPSQAQTKVMFANSSITFKRYFTPLVSCGYKVGIDFLYFDGFHIWHDIMFAV